MATNLSMVFDDNYFDDPEITLKRLQKFTGEVRVRMKADDLGGRLIAIEAEIGDHADDLFGDMQAVDQGTGLRRGNAQQMWAALRGLDRQLDEDDELIWLKAKKDTKIGTAFFPTGSRREYSRATLLTADTLFARAVKAAHDHATALGSDFDPGKYDALKTAFDNARKGTREGDAQVGAGRADTADEHKRALQLALTRAVKLVAAALPHDPARARKYFPTELLLPGQPGDPDEPDPVPPVTPAP